MENITHIRKCRNDYMRCLMSYLFIQADDTEGLDEVFALVLHFSTDSYYHTIPGNI